MHGRAIVLALAASLLLAVLVTPNATAKGGYQIEGAGVSGGRLGSQVVNVAIVLPEGYDEMYERQPPVIESMSSYESGGYHIELRYDFQDSGHGHLTWLGFYDGQDVLFFSADMRVGNGVWSAGWYTASPLLATALQSGLDPLPPAAGTGSRDDGSVGIESLGARPRLIGAAAVSAIAMVAGAAGVVSCRRSREKRI